MTAQGLPCGIRAIHGGAGGLSGAQEGYAGGVEAVMRLGGYVDGSRAARIAQGLS